ncbi:hypothetical protein [Pontiella sp.]|uniref:hypothetical protein n=1 Tax=Pontiella sp. TaxID=2837462 RepID=UPI0035653265
MHTDSTVKHWMHVMHDEGARMSHSFMHVLHEKSFWGIVSIIAVLALLLTLIVLFGEKVPIHEYGIPSPYGYY